MGTSSQPALTALALAKRFEVGFDFHYDFPIAVLDFVDA